MAGLLRTIFSSFGSVSILFYIVLNFSFALLELTYGIWSNSLSLVSDSFHMLFDCVGMAIGLVAQSVIRGNRGSNLKYTYGYGRADAVAGFASSCFLMFLVFMLCGEASQRIVLKSPAKTENLIQIAGAGLGVNILGVIIIYFNRRSSANRYYRAPRASLTVKFHDNQDEEYGILLGMMLHAIADALGSVAVIGSSVLVEQLGTPLADPGCSVVIALLLMMGIVPLLKDCKDVLMQRAPRELDTTMPVILHHLVHLPGVHSVKDPHIWVLHKHYFVSTFVLVLFDNDSKLAEESVIWGARSTLEERGIKSSTIELEYHHYNKWELAVPEVSQTAEPPAKGTTPAERTRQRKEKRAARAEERKKRAEKKALKTERIPATKSQLANENAPSSAGAKPGTAKKLKTLKETVKKFGARFSMGRSKLKDRDNEKRKNALEAPSVAAPTSDVALEQTVSQGASSLFVASEQTLGKE